MTARRKASEELALGFDWETTGLTLHPDAPLRKQPFSIEFGGALLSLRTGKVVDTMNVVINPGFEVEPIITKITGHTNEFLAAHRPFIAEWPEIRKFFDRATAMFAHNLPFDKMILSLELMRNGVTDFEFPARPTCTVGLYREQYGRNPKLSELYEDKTGKPANQKHQALADVMLMVEIVQKEELWQVM